MLHRLYIKNVVLIDSCELLFASGFTVVTGETGAGKSVLLSAISLLLGYKQDSSIIRQGENQAFVEASFDIDGDPILLQFLEESGIEHDSRDALIIKREVLHSGKSRCYVNNSSVPLNFLRKLAPFLIELSEQHTHVQLLDEERPLELLDQFANLHETKKEFQKAHALHQLITKRIKEHLENKSARLRLIETCQREINEIENANLIEGEDEALFSDYSKQAEEAQAAQVLQELLCHVETEEHSLLSVMARQKPAFEKLAQLRSEFQAPYHSYCLALEDIKEVAYQLNKEAGKLDVSSETLARLEARLQELDGLKRKYGHTVADILAWKGSQQQLLRKLEHEDESFDELQETLRSALQDADRLAAILSEKRRQTAAQLSKQVTHELRQLNMPHAEFEVVLAPGARTDNGDEMIYFFLTPNRGEMRLNIQHGASGGELARLSLCLQSIICQDKEHVCIVFDEVDANIGGTTASIVGKKLQELAARRQVIAVTHFPQVAIYGNAHFQIRKIDDEARTYSRIEQLETAAQRQEELTRMVGGQELFTNFAEATKV